MKSYRVKALCCILGQKACITLSLPHKNVFCYQSPLSQKLILMLKCKPTRLLMIWTGILPKSLLTATNEVQYRHSLLTNHRQVKIYKPFNYTPMFINKRQLSVSDLVTHLDHWYSQRRQAESRLGMFSSPQFSTT